MFREKCIIIMYKTRTNTGTFTGSYSMTGRFVSYTKLFIAAKEKDKKEVE